MGLSKPDSSMLGEAVSTLPLETLTHILDDVVSCLRLSPQVRSIILVGSYSRGDAHAYSDIDLLVISEDSQTESTFYSFLPDFLRIRQLSLLPYSTGSFDEMYKGGTLFIAHVIGEGRVLFDDGFYFGLRRIPFRVSRASLLVQWKIIKHRVELFDDLSIYGRVFVDCLSHLYSIVKNIAIIALALGGHLEFSKESALTGLASLFPELRTEIMELRQLHRFYLIWHKSAAVRPPFSPVDCKDRTEVLISCVKRIIAKVERTEIKIED